MQIKTKLYPLILCGGEGTRLWPVSTKSHPKPFHVLGHETLTLFEQTLVRLNNSEIFYPPSIICAEDHRFLVADNLRKQSIKSAKIVLEPCARNTAPAILAGALKIYENDPDAVLFVAPSDHLIPEDDNSLFYQSAIQALDVIEEKPDIFVVFGVKPDRPETGYGYIHAGEALSVENAFSVNGFKEKPDQKTAKQYLDEGAYFWNAGMFVFKTKTLIEFMKYHHPELYACVQESVQRIVKDDYFYHMDKNSFLQASSISIDYAVMEAAKNIAMVQTSYRWSDLGTWQAIADTVLSDENGNKSTGHTAHQNSRNVFVYSDTMQVGTKGVEDLNIIVSDDTILVSNKSCTDDIKPLIEEMDKKNNDTK